jgi:drug/metabolite transporter, DME family
LSVTSVRPVRRAALLGRLQVCLAGVLWGTGGLALELIRDHVPLGVLTVSAYRMLLAALVLTSTVVALRRVRVVLDLLRRDLRPAVLVGCGTAAYQGLYFASVVQAGVTVATVVSLGLAPVLLTVAAGVRSRTVPDARRLLVLTAALAGLVAVSTAAGAAGTGPRPALGILLAAGSGATFAATTAYGRPVSQRNDPLALTTVAVSAGALALVPAALLTGGPHVTTDPAALAGLLYLGAFTMALAYLCLYAGLRTTTSAVAVLASLLEPVTAAVAAAVVLGERIGGLGVAGIVLVLAAVVSADRTPEDVPAATPSPVSPARGRRRR